MHISRERGSFYSPICGKCIILATYIIFAIITVIVFGYVMSNIYQGAPPQQIKNHGQNEDATEQRYAKIVIQPLNETMSSTAVNQITTEPTTVTPTTIPPTTVEPVELEMRKLQSTLNELNGGQMDIKIMAELSKFLDGRDIRSVSQQNEILQRLNAKFVSLQYPLKIASFLKIYAFKVTINQKTYILKRVVNRKLPDLGERYFIPSQHVSNTIYGEHFTWRSIEIDNKETVDKYIKNLKMEAIKHIATQHSGHLWSYIIKSYCMAIFQLMHFLV